MNIEMYQTRNKDFFRAGEFSWNYGTSINIHLQYNEETPAENKYPVFSPRGS